MVKLKMAPEKTFTLNDLDLKWGIIPVTLVLLYQLGFIFFGLDFSDSFFFANNYIRAGAAEVHPTYFLTTYFGHYWSVLFGSHILAFRTFNWLLNAVFMLSPLLLLKKPDQKYFILYYVLGSIVLAPEMATYLLSFDTFTNFFLVLSLVLLLKHISSPGAGLLVAIGTLSAVLIGCRIPNLLVVPVVGGVLIADGVVKKHSFVAIFRALLVYGGSVLAAFGLIVILYYGSVTAYFDKLIAQIAFESTAGHETSKLLENYLRDFIMVWLYAAFIGLVYFINKLNYKTPALRYLGGAISAIIVLVFFYKFIKGAYYNWQLVLFLNAVLLSYVLIYFFENLKAIRTSRMVAVFSVAVFSYIPAFGSDTGLLKTYAVFALVPFLFTCFRVKHLQIFIGLLLLLSPVAVIDKLYVIYEDDPVLRLKETHAYSGIDHIYTTPANVAYVKEVAGKFNGLKAKNQEVVFYGNNSHLFNYLLKGSEKVFGTFKMDLDNAGELDKMVETGKTRKPVFFIVDRAFRADSAYPGLQKIDAALSAIGYRRENAGPFVCYFPAGKN